MSILFSEAPGSYEVLMWMDIKPPNNEFKVYLATKMFTHISKLLSLNKSLLKLKSKREERTKVYIDHTDFVILSFSV